MPTFFFNPANHKLQPDFLEGSVGRERVIYCFLSNSSDYPTYSLIRYQVRSTSGMGFAGVSSTGLVSVELSSSHPADHNTSADRISGSIESAILDFVNIRTMISV